MSTTGKECAYQHHTTERSGQFFYVWFSEDLRGNAREKNREEKKK